ncbi:type IV pilin protein [Nitrincola alkalisediminis]|uniref:type IV pilin protein n=1 Tax=Nitrincola alkalisediminis TaxID=1366656 RepID=UPI00187674DA|nr:type IV pilin protein [Nitrincola alkalisediminis]
MHNFTPRRVKGFTLIELMITVAIIGIIAAIAYPSYQNSVIKSNRTQAQACILEAAQFMERFYTLNARYDQQRGTNPPVAVALNLNCINEINRNYALGLVAANLTANTYSLRATPVANSTQANDRCGSLTLNHQGLKGVINGNGATVAECW